MEDEVRREVVHALRARIDDFQVEQKLVDAIARLPDKVRTFALERCYFVAIGGNHGGFFVSPEYIAGRTLIVLNSCWKIDAFQSAVAHEIAHPWRGHPDADLGAGRREARERGGRARPGMGFLLNRHRPIW